MSCIVMVIFTITVSNYDQSLIDLSIVEGPPVGEDTPEESFDGRAYVVWACGSGTCYHYFDDIQGFEDGNSTFYKESTIKADNNQSITFDIHASKIGWVLGDDFARWEEAYLAKHSLGVIDWTSVNPNDIIGEPTANISMWEDEAVNAGACVRPAEDASKGVKKEFRACVDEYLFNETGTLPFVKLQPLNEPTYNNSLVSYGDRSFKVVIYNDNYKGVAMGDISTLNYYPSSWANPFIKRDQFDISGSTKKNPTVLDSILLEDTVKIKALNYNNFEIKSIEALDVPADAVTITKANGEFSIVFSSNFYDNVIFKVTDTADEVSYIKIKRYTIDAAYKNNRVNKPVVAADFYFDRTKSYEDFKLTLKILYKDGTTKSVPMVAIFGIDDGLGNITEAYEVDEEAAIDAGKGLKKSYYEYELTDGEINTIDKMYINAEFAGGDPGNYAGAYAGSGYGVEVHVEGGE